MKKRFATVLSLILFVSLMVVDVFAAGKIAIDKNCKLSVTYQYGDEILSNINVDLYRVADITEYGQLTLTKEFEQYPVEIGNYDGGEWNELATTLKGYIYQDANKENGPKAAHKGKTDGNGKVTFPKENASLTPGLYMIMGEKFITETSYYLSDPVIVRLPREDYDENTWVYEVNCFPKVSRKDVQDDDDDRDKTVPDTVSRKVLKIWDDNGYEENRPDSIAVNLLKDNEVVETVNLDDSNNWTYTWTNLEKGADWNVTEEVPAGYHVTITREGNSFIVRNRLYDKDLIGDADDSDGNNLSAELMPGVLGAYDELPFGLLPQTGTTWWLAITLAGIGAMLLAAGMMLGKEND